jgi:apolipoprotein N-acyltransferase
MESKSEVSKLPTWLAATALTALAWWFGSGVHPLWWLIWLAPVPVLWLAPRVRARWAALAAFVAYTLGGFNVWAYMHHYIGLPMPVIVYAISLAGVLFTLCTVLYRQLLLRGHPIAAALAVPAVWVTLEYINNVLSPHGTFFNIGYTQMNMLPVIQVAAITGIWGIGFLVLLFPAALAVEMTSQTSSRSRITIALITVALVAASLTYGYWRLQVPAASTLRVGLAWLENQDVPISDSADGHALQARYADAIHHMAAKGVQAVVIPEASFMTGDATIPAFAEISQQDHLILDTGVDFRTDQRPERNMVMVFQPGATMPIVYSKHHLIPGLEDKFTPGQDFQLLKGSPRIGLAICKDMDFHDIGHAYAERGAQLLLVPAGDFVVDGWLHSRMAIMRGVENGFAVARVARFGRLTLSDDRGRVVAEASSEQHGTELIGDVPLRETHTLYSRWGDWFAWLNVLGVVVLVALAYARRPH